MKRLLAIAFALFAVSTAQAQQKTTAQIKNDITTLFPTTGAGLITANQLRQVTNEMADSYANKGGDTFNGLLTINGNLSIPTNATNTVSLAGGDIGGGGIPRLLFKPATAITPPNNTLVGFGTAATWPFTYVDYQSSLVTIIDPYGAGSQFNAMRTSDWLAGNANPLNMTSLTVHDKAVLGVPVWGAYDDLERTAGASATNFFGREMSFHNMGASISGDPFNVNPSGESVLLRLDSGVATGTGNAVTSALDILNNGGKFNAGIKFGDGAIDTVSGHVNAIQMSKGQEVVWYGSAATPTGSVSTDANGALQLTGIAGVNVSIGPVNTAGSYKVGGINIADYSSRYGVKCDGTTDDTTAMQNFINAVQNSATILGLGTGVGIINSGGSDGECIVSGLTITRPLTLQGLGSSSTSLRLKAGSTTPLFTISVAYATTNYYSLGFLPARVTLKNMRLSSTDGATGSANAHGIALVNNGTNPIYTNVTLDDVEIWKISGAGLYAHSWNGGLQAKNLWIWYSHGHNVDLASVADFRFRGMDLGSAGQDNLNISGVTESTCIDCNIYAATRFNVNAFGSTNFTFEGNTHFDIAGQHGVYANLNSSGWLRFIGSTHRWSSQAATATYSDIYAETGSAGAIYLIGAHFNSGNGGYAGTPKYKLELNAASTTKFVVDPTTVFEDGAGTLAAVSNNPGAIFGGGSGTTQVLPLAETATLAAATTYYLGPLGSTTTNTLAPFTSPGACVVTGLRMATTQFPGAGQSYAYTLYKNGSATGMTGSISGGAANTLSLNGSITFAANDNFQMQVVTSATATAGFHNGSLLMRCWL